MRRAAVLLVLGVIAILEMGIQPTALARARLANPVTCQFGGTVLFQPPGLTIAGTATTARRTAPARITGTSLTGCTGGVTGASISMIAMRERKNNKSSTRDQFYYDQFGEFFNQIYFMKSSNHSKLIISTDQGTSLFKIKAVSLAIGKYCPNTYPPFEVGFVLNGKVTGGPFPTEAATLTACFGPDSGPGTTGSFLDDFGTEGVTMTGTMFDPVTSSLTF